MCDWRWWLRCLVGVVTYSRCAAENINSGTWLDSQLSCSAAAAAWLTCPPSLVARAATCHCACAERPGQLHQRYIKHCYGGCQVYCRGSDTTVYKKYFRPNFFAWLSKSSMTFICLIWTDSGIFLAFFFAFFQLTCRLSQLKVSKSKSKTSYGMSLGFNEGFHILPINGVNILKIISKNICQHYSDVQIESFCIIARQPNFQTSRNYNCDKVDRRGGELRNS